MKQRRRGLSYRKRVMDVNSIYERYAKSGLSNREIWRRHVYPVFFISERTFYNMLKAPALIRKAAGENRQPSLFPEYDDPFYGLDNGNEQRVADPGGQHP